MSQDKNDDILLNLDISRIPQKVHAHLFLWPPAFMVSLVWQTNIENVFFIRGLFINTVWPFIAFNNGWFTREDIDKALKEETHGKS